LDAKGQANNLKENVNGARVPQLEPKGGRGKKGCPKNSFLTKKKSKERTVPAEERPDG